MSSSDKTLLVGARASALSRAQVREVFEALQQHHPYVKFETHFVTTVGDRDQQTSLRFMDRSDFFTREIDEGVLNHSFDIGIHSAKDLPLPLKTGLTLFCLTKGVDPSDALVLAPGTTLHSLPSGAKIATSSLRREQMIKQLRPDLCFCDIRGTIEQRLSLLESGAVQGVVIAEAALIRLNLTHLNRITVAGPTAEGQGQLAVVGRSEDTGIKALFANLDVNNRFPVIQVPLP